MRIHHSLFALALLLAIAGQARAQYCIGTNERDLAARVSRLQHHGGATYDVYSPTGVQLEVAEAADDEGRDDEVRAFAHTTLVSVQPKGADNKLAFTLHVFRGEDVGLMCPQYDVAASGHSAEGAKENWSRPGPHDRKDFIELELRTTAGGLPRLIGVLRPRHDTRSKLIVKVTVDDATARAVASIPDPSQATFALRSTWFGISDKATTADRNGEIHHTGLDKVPLVSVRLKAMTESDFQALEREPKASWHGGGNLGAEGLYKSKRDALVARHRGALAPADALSTTLEGESEYRLSKQQFDVASAALLRLSKQKPAGFTVAAKGGGTTTDTYYDLKDSQYALLSKKLLLRRRSVATDDPKLFMFAMKANSMVQDGLMVRLSAQFNMKPASALGADALTKLAFESEWNPFARILREAFTSAGGSAAALQGKLLVPVMKVVSNRKKFSITGIAGHDGQTIDVTIDSAHGETIDGLRKTPEVYSMEFGIDHPGVNVVSRAATGREHHIPSDLRAEVFQREDVAPFKATRKHVIDEVNHGLATEKLDPVKNTGGYKAVELATALGLLGGTPPISRSASSPALTRKAPPAAPSSSSSSSAPPPSSSAPPSSSSAPPQASTPKPPLTRAASTPAMVKGREKKPDGAASSSGGQ